MTRIVVSPLSKLEAQIALHQPSYIVTLSSGDLPCLPYETKRLSLIFNDIVEPRDGLVMPEKTHVEQLLEFVKIWDQEKPLLIHCYAGISRSTASAFIAALALNSELDEAELASKLRAVSPSATPNIRLIELADQILGRKGRMVEAIRGIGRGQHAFEGEVFSLPVVS
ncbi:tyrosine phosphatase family protein [Brucella thiophenivorans]|uniref:Putative tyrosine phosphatase n=1 Tax=Brucella thiophenivorans TaxID=571255 RepID=A0A256FV67_9HYPH|nr:tyrosine phosphatase family protein [Brucella thiophenivorans]OYR18713.1 putative tyrosine phosphatase [Brucella thiophenivorans]